jgi:hypothetical protein
MRILLVADDRDDSIAAETALVAEGHEVDSCNDEFGSPCRGIDHLENCPLESHIDLAVIARSANTHRGLGEMGSICATRHRIGVVEIDPSERLDESLEQKAAIAERAVCYDYERTILGALAQAGAGEGVYVTVHRHQGAVLVTLTIDAAVFTAMSEGDIAALADRTRDATRQHDRFARSIDVSVICPER